MAIQLETFFILENRDLFITFVRLRRKKVVKALMTEEES